MTVVGRIVFLVSVAAACWPASAVAADKQTKQTAIASITRQRKNLIDMSDKIWAYAETALRETHSSRVLADYAQAQGFKVERGVSGMPTAFVATYGQGRPIIGVLGEYDALPGISQQATTVKKARKPGAPGHGCGHNLFGTASLGAAVAIKELIADGTLSGTIRFYGTPAEEAIGGKIYMARDGLFDDLDVCLAWHPSDETKADMTSSQALVDFIVEFRGQTAHAAADPWNGRSALDGVELFTHGLNMLREHVRPSVRIHYTIAAGGIVPNVVPDYARVWCWVRDWERSGVEEVLGRVREIARGAGIMAGVESELTIQSGDYEMLVNEAGAALLHQNLMALGPLVFTPEQHEFAKKIQRATGVPELGLDGSIHSIVGQVQEGGSTDVGDVSWLVPTLHFSVTTAPKGAPWHAWPVVACGGMSIGHKGMVYAAKNLATTMIDLFEKPNTVAAIQAEFKRKTQGAVYKPYIPDGPAPVPTDLAGDKASP